MGNAPLTTQYAAVMVPYQTLTSPVLSARLLENDEETGAMAVEVGGRMSEVGGQREGTEVGCRMSDVGGKRQRSEVRGRRSEVGLPDKVMMTVHPQRWDDRPWPWVKELVGQNVKNIVKKWMIRFAKDEWMSAEGHG